jgi:hypothetical protein
MWTPEYGRQKPPFGVQLNPSHPLARGLVGSWLFNEASGGIVNDLSGNGNTGALTAMPWASSAMGPSLTGSSSGFVLVPDTDLVDTGAISICMGVIPAAVAAGKGLMYKGSWASTWGSWALHQHSPGATPGVVTLRINTSTIQVDGATTLPALVHTNVAATAGAAGLRVYLNGVLDGSAAGAAVASDSSPIRIGSYYAEYFSFAGKITYAYLYNRILTAPEVATIDSDPYAMYRAPRCWWFGTGAGGAGPVNLSTVNGLAKASISKVNALEIANTSKFNGLT